MSTAPRNLIVCCDGTNNLWSAADDVTNIVKIFRRLQQSDEQLCYYDPGVGAASGQLHESSGLRQRLARLAGLAWGNGVWKNVADAYFWLIQNYREGDRIYLVGFSRGAFTVRALAGLLYWCHLPRENCEHLIPTFIDAYRVSDTAERRRICRELRRYHSRSRNFEQECFPIEFIGVFDTVESVGLEQIFLGTEVISDNKVKKGVRFVRHAMAIDESRWTFEPRPYQGTEEPSEPATVPRLKQVWFPGAHSDVGGGYQEHGLSDLVLSWLIEEMLSLPHAPNFISGWETDLDPDPCGHRHDQMRQSTFWALTGRCHRELLDQESTPLTVSQATLDRLKFTHWSPPLPSPALKFEVEPYGPRLAKRLSTKTRIKGREKSDAFSAAAWRGFLLFGAWLLLCLVPKASRELATLQLTEIFNHQAALERFVGNLSWFGSVIPLPVGTWLALDAVAILLAAYWIGVGITGWGESSGGKRSLGMFLAYAAPTALIADLIENLFTALLAGPWITEALLGSTFLGVPIAWLSLTLSLLLSVASAIKLAAYLATMAALVWMAISRQHRRSRELWMAGLGLNGAPTGSVGASPMTRP
ncbi:MAG: DUF2235 domain-containing protein [Verrucomicrobiales bacterium]|nr:DUF2235 domain-containing protein [Verrucomicrobiales bacterium]